MRRLIQNKATTAFLSRSGTWTHDVLQAADLPDQWWARDKSDELHSQDLELYYLFGEEPDPRYDFTVPLHHAA